MAAGKQASSWNGSPGWEGSTVGIIGRAPCYPAFCQAVRLRNAAGMGRIAVRCYYTGPIP
jgi:hypothetical protein